MKLFTALNNAAQYLSEAIGRIFGPSDDAYPATGVQPFTGDVPADTPTKDHH